MCVFVHVCACFYDHACVYVYVCIYLSVSRSETVPLCLPVHMYACACVKLPGEVKRHILRLSHLRKLTNDVHSHH